MWDDGNRERETTMESELVNVRIDRDYNDDGVRSYLVTPYYRLRCGRVVSVPDSRGWETFEDARSEADRIVNG